MDASTANSSSKKELGNSLLLQKALENSLFLTSESNVVLFGYDFLESIFKPR
jgi:hypothetical protein